jgi:hypothetical protein
MIQAQQLKPYEDIIIADKLIELVWAECPECGAHRGIHCQTCGDTRLRFSALTDESPSSDHCTEDCELCGGTTRVAVVSPAELLGRVNDYILDYEYTDLDAAIEDLCSLWKSGDADVMRKWDWL